MLQTNRSFQLSQDTVFYILNMCPWNWFGHPAEVTSIFTAQDRIGEATDGIGWWNSNYRRMLREHETVSYGSDVPVV